MMIYRFLIRVNSFMLRKIDNIVMKIRSGIATYQLTGRIIPVKVRILDARAGFRCVRHKNATVTVRGVISVTSWLGNRTPVYIELGEGAELRVEGDLTFGPNVRMSVSQGATLSFGGRSKESGSGLTENVIILVQKSVEIGKDFLGAWGLFITDADHHRYGDSNPPIPVKIGDHVWMCPESSVMKGASVGSNSVITQRAVVLEGDYPDNSLIGGMPARRLGTAKKWHR